MTLLHICSDFFFTTVYSSMIDSLDKIGIKSKVFIPTDRKSKQNTNNDNVIECNCLKKSDRFLYFRKQRKIVDSIKNIIKTEKPDLLHAHFLFTNGYACMVCKDMFNIPYVVALRNTDVNFFFKRMYHLRKIGVKILENASKIVFLNQTYCDTVLAKYVPKIIRNDIAKKSEIIPNGIDSFWLNNKYNRNRFLKKDEVNVITIGTIDKNKNQLVVARALEMLHRKGIVVNYVVIGRVIDKYLFRRLTSYSFVKHLDFCNKEDLVNYYRDADIFVMPSKHETFGLVYAEAMTQGLPLIYTKGQGFDKQFDEGIVGFSVPYDSPQLIASKIQVITRNYSYYSSNCINFSSKFSWEHIADIYSKIYYEILEINPIRKKEECI